MKVTKEQIQSKIKGEMYMVLPDGRSTLCILTLANGYTIKGLAACVDESNFDVSIGRKVAYQNAFDQIWPLEGYLLAERLHSGRVIPSKVVVKKVRRPKAVKKPVERTAEAPWGLKKDGTPKQRPGRKVKA